MNPEVLTPPWHVAHVIGHMRTGGAERQLLNYLLEANRDDFRHSLLCLEPPGELAKAVESSGVPVIHLPVRTRFAINSVNRYAKYFTENDVAVVHTHMHHAALWGRMGGLVAGVPVLVTTEHGKELWKNGFQVWLDRFLSKRTARHIAVSMDGLNQRIQRERVASDKLVLIPNGVPIPPDGGSEEDQLRLRREFGLGPDTPVVGSVGRLVVAKGYDHFLDAMALVRMSNPSAVWLAVGDGELKGDLKAKASAMGLEEAIVWAGRRDDVAALLPIMDVWVMSSIREGLPVALLEAMAAGRPIVATRVGGIPDAIKDRKEGLLAPPADAPALAKAIGELLSEPDLAGQLGRDARLKAEDEYGIGNVARRIEDVYRQELESIMEREKKR